MTSTNENIPVLKDHPRETIEVYLPGGRVISGERGLSVEKFFKALPVEETRFVVGAVVNGELKELTFPIDMDAKVRPVTMMEADGARIYRRSLTFLLETVFNELFPNAQLTVDHSVSSGGFFCQVNGRAPLTLEELQLLEKRVRDLVETDQPFKRCVVPIKEAIEYFDRNGFDDKVHLLRYRQKEFLVLYQLGNHRDYHHGYMVPSTGYLKWFGMAPMGEGFVLRFPRRHLPDQLLPMPDYPMLLTTFRQYGDWLSRLGIDNVGALDDAIATGKAREVILVAEALHEQKISDIAHEIVKKSDKARVILIAGPSSSGKTTFSKRLMVQLLAQGLSPLALEMDHYFVDRDQTPKDENGDYDFEAFEALNSRQLEDDLLNMLAGKEVHIPHYDFKSGKSLPGEIVSLKKDQLIILEGIHGLNPNLLRRFSGDETFRIYVSCLTQLNLDRQNRISTTDSRLIRRIVRDAATRGYSAIQTLQRWESVRRGEKKHIFPHQENANELFNSALVYELAALKPLAEPLLRQVPFGTPEYIEAKRLLALLEWFVPINPELIPDNSIIREFVGGSILTDFTAWKNSNLA